MSPAIEGGGSRLLVRDARIDDVPAIVDFNMRLALETEDKRLDPAILTAGVEKAIAHPDRLRYRVAETIETGRVVGQAAVTTEWSDWRNGWIWWFQSVYVHADARGMGVFRAIHRAIRDEAMAAGDVLGLRLYVEENNGRAQDTYRALGMKPPGYLVFEEMW